MLWVRIYIAFSDSLSSALMIIYKESWRSLVYLHAILLGFHTIACLFYERACLLSNHWTCNAESELYLISQKDCV